MESGDSKTNYRTANQSEITADVIVVGLGAAGGCAAVEAFDAGVEVLVIEKQPEHKHISNTRMSGGGFHSPALTGDRNALKEYAKAMFSGENLPWKFEGEQPDLSDELAEAWVKYAPHNKNFLRNLDPDFKTVDFRYIAFPEFPGAKESQYTVCRSSYSGKVDYEIANKETGEVAYEYKSSMDLQKSDKEGGEAIHACILYGIKERGIKVHYETRAKKLRRSESGEVIGVEAVKGGQKVFYQAKRAVVLASGGFEFNKALKSAFLEGPGDKGWAFYGTPANTGDGIIMALEIGSALSKVSKASARLAAAVTVEQSGLRTGLPVNAIGKANEIVVDNYGKRYAAERRITKDPSRYIFYKEVVVFDTLKLLYPRVPSWMIFDETLKSQKAIVTIPVARYHSIPWAEDNSDAVEKGWILQANTIEDLAVKINKHPDNCELMDPDVLVSTVREFNDMCIKGKDHHFGRELETLGPINKPPFYAIPLYIGGPNTKGGIKANAKAQVIDWDGNPIPRLYSAGEISSAFKFAYHAGGNVGECIVFGRIAGKNAASEKPS